MTIQFPVIRNLTRHCDRTAVTHDLTQEYRQDQAAIGVNNTLHFNIFFTTLGFIGLGARFNQKFIKR